MDMETCAMGFRMLRMHGYDISCGTRGLKHIHMGKLFVVY